jgi:hypothetical protein
MRNSDAPSSREVITMQARFRGKRGDGATPAGADPVAKTDEDVDAALVDAALMARSRLDERPAAPRQAASGYVLSPLAKMALARARMRAVIPLDAVTFVAACPACGADCEWTQEREETRVRSYQNCPCRP